MAMPPISDPNHPDHLKWQEEHAGGNAGEPEKKPRKKAEPAKKAAPKASGAEKQAVLDKRAKK